jgi:hypothetical protein
MMQKAECHCGKDGHALGSVNCPVHGDKPRITLARDEAENVFEAYELRSPKGQSIFIDRALVDGIAGGIKTVRAAISPHFMIVCEILI